jgi:hypothetical protein
VVATTRAPAARASWRANREGEQGHAAGAEREDGLAGEEREPAGERVPGGDGGARQGGHLLEGEVRGHGHERVLVEHDVLGEHPIERAAQLGGDLRAERPRLPAREDRRHHPVAGGGRRDPFAHGGDLAGAVARRDEVLLQRQRVAPLPHDEELAGR